MDALVRSFVLPRRGGTVGAYSNPALSPLHAIIGEWPFPPAQLHTAEEITIIILRDARRDDVGSHHRASRMKGIERLHNKVIVSEFNQVLHGV